MARASTRNRLQRLEHITARLKSAEPLIIADIAEEVGVSVRTLSRDLQLLRERGLPIETERGRGGGVQLRTNWRVGRIDLNHSEAVDLLISLAVAERMKSPFLMANLRSVRRKLMASFSSTVKLQMNKLKSRILIARTASPQVLTAFATPKPSIVEPLHQAFFAMQEILIHYRSGNNEQTKRIIEPHYLLLSYPIWYIVAWDHLRDDIRTFRCDRIGRIRIREETFRLRSPKVFEKVIEVIGAIEP